MSSFTQYIINAILRQQQPAVSNNNIAIAGSSKEGSMVARVFKPSTTQDGLNREIELDLEYNSMEVPRQFIYLIEDIAGKEGFIRVRSDVAILGFASKAGWKGDPKDYEEVIGKVSAHGYIHPYSFREEVLENLKVRNENKKIEFILAAALNVELDRISLSHPSESSVGTYMDILVDNEVKLKLSWDIVTIMKLDWWPDVAKEWIERERKWPDKDTIAELSRFVYIVTKPSGYGAEEKETFEMRYYFAHVERALITKRSDHQTFIYLVFKSILYTWIKPIATDRIHFSFIGKTVMFWVCEQYPPDDPLWLEENTMEVLKLLFRELLAAVEKHEIPDYFIPNINVIGKLDDKERKEISQQIKAILADTDQFIPGNVDEGITACNEMVNIVKSAYKVLHDIEHKDYKILIKRPDLLPKAAEIYGAHLLDIGSGGKDELDQYFTALKDGISEKFGSFMEGMKKHVSQETVDKYKDVVNLDVIEETVNKVKDFDLKALKKKANDFLKKLEL